MHWIWTITADVAATILHMLYIKDLRGLQTIIDETIVNVQVSSVKQLERCLGVPWPASLYLKQ